MKMDIRTKPTALAVGLAFMVGACGESKNTSPPTDDEIGAVVRQYRQMTLTEPHDPDADLVEFVSAKKVGAGATASAGEAKQFTAPVKLTYRAVGDVSEYSCVTGSTVPEPHIRVKTAPDRETGQYIPIRKGETFSCENEIVFQLTEYGWIPDFGDMFIVKRRLPFDAQGDVVNLIGLGRD